MSQASHEFRGSVDFNQNELRNATFQRLITPPISPVQGQIYYNTTIESPFFWDTLKWKPFGLPAVHIKYVNETAMIANQTSQIEGYIYHDENLDIYYEYLGTTIGDINDYNPIGGQIISGTTNYVSKFNVTGDNVEDSRIFDNGTNIGIGTTDFTDPAPLVISGRVSQVDLGNSTYFGFEAGLSDDLSGNVNTGFGYRALKATIGAITGYQNSAFGAYSLQANTTGYDNTAIGRSALGTATTAYYNTAVGSAAMVYTTTGSWNTGIGTFSLITNTTGSYNTGIGVQALNDNTTGSWNTVVGARALENVPTGSFNTVLGGYAAQAAESLSNSVIIGYNARPKNLFNDTNEIVIGYNLLGNGSNTLTIGNTSIIKNYFSGTVKHAPAILDEESVILSQLNTAINGVPAYNHPVYTSQNITAIGASVISLFTSDGIGSVTNITTRTLTAGDLGAQLISEKDQVNGYPSLDGTGRVPAFQLPSSIPITQVFTYSSSNIFSLSFADPDIIYVSLNGQLQRNGGLYDWTVSGTSLTVTAPLRSGDEIIISYYSSLPMVTSYNRNIDGGAPDSIYLPIQNVDGGTP
tara:strand:+ start:4937 stop:6673 length:1737 start_codon:yes stop_codon:yes gene_type:complete